MPALLNMTCSPPKVATAKSTSSRICSWSLTSVRLKAASGPSSAATSWPFSSLTSAMTTFAPSAMNRVAVPRPMPDDPPVTIATFPASSSAMRAPVFDR